MSKTTPVMFKYPELGDAKPRPNQEVMLIKNDCSVEKAKASVAASLAGGATSHRHV